MKHRIKLAAWSALAITALLCLSGCSKSIEELAADPEKLNKLSDLGQLAAILHEPLTILAMAALFFALNGTSIISWTVNKVSKKDI
jgi:hypothetical protein